MARNPRHDILFEPVSFGPKTMRNRFWQSAHCSGFGSERPGTQAYFRGMKAEGGWGVVCTEACSVHPESDDYPFDLARLWDDGDVINLGKMTEAAHSHGSLAGVQLWYNGLHSPSLETREVSLSPSGFASQPHVRGFEGERRLGFEARRYCRQAGGCFGHGIRSERAISASIRLLPRRPASGGQTTPLSSRRVAAGDQQIREPQQQRDALPVLCHAPVAHLGVAEVPLHVQERLNLRPQTPCTPSPSSRRRPGFIANATRHRRPGARDASPPPGLRRPTPSSQRHAAAPACVTSLGWPPSSSPMCAFIPKYHCLPFSSDASQGPVRYRRFFVDDGASMMLASTIVCAADGRATPGAH